MMNSYNGNTIITIDDVYRAVTRLDLYDITKEENFYNNEIRGCASRQDRHIHADYTFLIVDFVRIHGYPYVKVLDAEHDILGWIIGIPKSGVCTYFRNIREEE